MSFFDPADEADAYAHKQYLQRLRDRDHEPDPPTFDPDPSLCACKGSGEVLSYPYDLACPHHEDEWTAEDEAWAHRLKARDAAERLGRPELANYDEDALRDRLEGWE